MDCRRMKEEERESRLLFNMFGNEGKVKATEVTGEQHTAMGEL